MWYLLENYSTDPFIKFSRQHQIMLYSCRKSDGLAWIKKQLRLVVVECNVKNLELEFVIQAEQQILQIILKLLISIGTSDINM
jgi:hypothetical protein